MSAKKALERDDTRVEIESDLIEKKGREIDCFFFFFLFLCLGRALLSICRHSRTSFGVQALDCIISLFFFVII